MTLAYLNPNIYKLEPMLNFSTDTDANENKALFYTIQKILFKQQKYVSE